MSIGIGALRARNAGLACSALPRPRLVVTYCPRRARKDVHDRERAIRKLKRELSNSDALGMLLSRRRYGRFLRLEDTSIGQQYAPPSRPSREGEAIYRIMDKPLSQIPYSLHEPDTQ